MINLISHCDINLVKLISIEKAIIIKAILSLAIAIRIIKQLFRKLLIGDTNCVCFHCTKKH